MATIDSVKLPDNSTYDVADNYSGYAKKVADATTDDLASLTATGDLADSGKKLSDLVLKSDVKDVLNSTSTTDPLSANMGHALADNLAADEESGAKNFNVYPYKDTTKSLNGITFTDNGDGTITVNGTATTITVFDMHLYLDNPCIVENGTYILSGCPSGGGISTYNIRAYEKNSGGTDVIIGNDYGNGVTLTLNGDYYDNDSVHLDLAIVVASGAVISTPITFKPMLRDARIIDPTFAPYAETNLQLTRKTSGLSNCNLLDNPFFTVNQRGQTNYTGNVYTLDRWKLDYAGSTSNIDVISSGVKINNLNSYTLLEQKLENITPLINRQLTASVLLSDGTILSGTGVYDGVNTINLLPTRGVLRLQINSVYSSFRIVSYSTTALTIRAVKLEVGSVSTLANDVAPDYALELAKCQTSTADPSDTYANQGQLMTSALQGALGAKNLNSLPYYESAKSKNGIIFTSDEKGIVTVSGTATARVGFYMHSDTNPVNKLVLPKGDYTLSGCPVGGAQETYCLRANFGGVLYYDTGNGVNFTISTDTQIEIAVIVESGTVISTPVIFYPMIRIAEDTDPNYQPYAKTNRQLTEEAFNNRKHKGYGTRVIWDADSTVHDIPSDGMIVGTALVNSAITLWCDTYGWGFVATGTSANANNISFPCHAGERWSCSGGGSMIFYPYTY